MRKVAWGNGIVLGFFFLVRASGGTAGSIAPRRDLAEHGGPDALAIGAASRQDPRRRARVVPHQTEQQVLGPDRSVPEMDRLAERELERLLRPRREGDVPRPRAAASRGSSLERARAEGLLDRPSHLVQVDADAPERVGVLVGEGRSVSIESPDVLTHVALADPEGIERPGAGRVRCAEDAQQEVLRPNVRTAKLACLLL